MRCLTDLVNGIAELVYPSRCQVCGIKTNPAIDAGALCPDCMSQAKYIMPPVPVKCGNLEIWAVCAYDGIIKECIHLLKYKSKVSLSVPLGRLMSNYVTKYMAPLTADAIAPVPLHASRLRQRGFNQAELLAKRVSASTGLPLYNAQIRRSRPTLAQAGLSKTQRRSNLRNAFAVKGRPAAVSGKNIMLVDDVFTTGSTLSECAGALLRAKVNSIEALVLAGGI